jgi:hypothetical protein
MDELYDDLTAKLDSLHMQGILESREWMSTDFIYIFIIDMPLQANFVVVSPNHLKGVIDTSEPS